MTPRPLYLETSVISYLAARPSRDLIAAARQQLTWQWWQRRRTRFELYASQLVVDEAAAGDPDAAKRRLVLLKDVPLLDISRDAEILARLLVDGVGLPPQASADALHIATATCHGMAFFLRGTLHISPTRSTGIESKAFAGHTDTNLLCCARPTR